MFVGVGVSVGVGVGVGVGVVVGVECVGVGVGVGVVVVVVDAVVDVLTWTHHRHNQVCGHSTGSNQSGVKTIPQKHNTTPKVVHLS